MSDQNSDSQVSLLAGLASTLSGLPWFEIVGQLWKFGRKVIRGMSNEGVYEVLEYEATLELKDRRGEQAIFHKREKVRYLQNYVLAYQDQAWGDGEILVDYKCSPGVPVDRYRSGYKTHILISLQEVKKKAISRNSILSGE
jgi:hypothetical protein